MIEQALVNYLNNYAPLTALIGKNVFYHRAPEKKQMPWVIITNSGGMRRRMTQGDRKGYSGRTEANDVLTLYVNAVSQFSCKEIADKVMDAIENYRGDMPPAEDTFFRCGTVRDLDGFNNTSVMLITVYVLYVFNTKFPN